MSPALLVQFESASSKLANNFLMPDVSPDRPALFESEFTFDNRKLTDFVSTGTTQDMFESNLDGDPVVKSFRNFTVNAGHTVTTTKRCKGLYLNILGNLVVNGTLSMTARGANTPGKFVVIHQTGKVIWYCAATPVLTHPEKCTIIGKVGGAQQTTRWNVGNPGINGACGSGGGGEWYDNGGLGSAGTSFSGGAGGGAHYGLSSSGGDGAPDGGAGGKGVRTNGGENGFTCSGGAGNPGGAGSLAGLEGQNGTGGLMILFVHGNITIGPLGTIVSNGSNGGKTSGHRNSRGGGGSGGGAIHIFHRGTINAQDKILAMGGIGGVRPDGITVSGAAGGNGTINIVKL